MTIIIAKKEIGEVTIQQDPSPKSNFFFIKLYYDY
jgi:hypothetical protein